MTVAQQLGIDGNTGVWTVGSNVETRAIVDPLPEGSWAVERRQAGLDVLVVGTDNSQDLLSLADDVIPLIGSIRIVWVIFPQPPCDIDADQVGQIADEYGWEIKEEIELDDTWRAVRLRQP